MKNTDWVIMPGYNEENHIANAISDVLKITNNLIVVDDGSIDVTEEIAKKKCNHVLRHKINLGKGAALKTGVEYAIKQGAKRFVFIDSDGQHEAKEIPEFLKKLDSGNDIVFGYRKLNKKMPFTFRLGNFVLSLVIFILFHIKLQDTQSGYRAMTKEAFERIKWKSSDYSVESEMIANAGKKKLKYEEIPINTIYHDVNKGTTVFNGLKIMLDMLKHKFKH